MILRDPEPYAVVTFDENDLRPERRQTLSMCLMFAFMLSAHIRLYFLMRSEVSRGVDRAFDQALRGLPMVSKGIIYLKDMADDEKAEFLERADLVLTTDPEIRRRMNHLSKPNLLVGFDSDRPPLNEWRYLEKLQDQMLKLQIIGNSQLIHAVYRAFHQRSSLGIGLENRFSPPLENGHYEEKQNQVETTF